MKHLIIFIGILGLGRVFGQNFEDGFSDGNFTANPEWGGTSQAFTIFDLNGNNVLRLADTQARVSYLSTPATNIDGFWEFFIQIDGTAPSGSNMAEVVLMSDIADLSSTFDGYGVKIGQTGEDVFHVVRYDAGNETEIIVSDTTVFKAGGGYRVKVTRDGTGNWSIEVGEGYFGELKNSGNSGFDNTYTSASFFGVKVSYTSSRTDDFYFDFKIEEPPVIIEPFFVKSFELTGASELSIGFNRDVDETSISNSDFLLNDDVNPQSISLVDADSLILIFSENFGGGEHQLRISGIESITRDTVLSDTTLRFFVFEEVEPGDILINEFLKDPPTGSGLSEYIELVNTSSKTLNLKDWKVGDNSSLRTISDTNFVFPPDTFLVLTSDPVALRSTFGKGMYLDVSLPSLNNTTDQIRLVGGDGNLADSLEYTPDWGGVDIALERRSTDVSGIFHANWGDSPNENGGTPGKSNEVGLDQDPPQLQSYELRNDSLVQIIYTEAIKQLPAVEKINYQLSVRLDNDLRYPEIERIEFTQPDTVLVHFTFALPRDVDGEHFSLIVQNQEDIFGNESQEILIDLALFKIEESDSADVLINEFMYDPPNGITEYVEIFNQQYANFNLKGWTISDNTGTERVISKQDLIVRERRFLVLVPDSSLLDEFPGTQIQVVSGFPSLNNSTDAIVIKNAEGLVIDSLTYFSNWGGNELALERRSIVFPATLQANWGDSPAQNYGTPGQRNEIEPDTSPPELLGYEVQTDSTIQLIYSEALDASTALNTENYQLETFFDMPVGFAPNHIELASPDSVLLDFGTFKFGASGNEILRVSRQRDVFGNEMEEFELVIRFIPTEKAEPGEVAINEFIYSPADDFTEFVELYNHTAKNFNLREWSLSDNTGSRKLITEQSFIFESGAYVVLAPDSTMSDLFPELSLIVVEGFPTLNNTTDAIVITNADGITIDSLNYSSDWGGNQVSLERRSVEYSANLKQNWADSPAELGGTPGSQNLIPVDNAGPKVIQVTPKSASEIWVIFDEEPQKELAENTLNYGIVPEFGFSSATLSSDTVTLVLGTGATLLDGTTYRLTVEHQQDVFGNESAAQEWEFTYIKLAEADFGKVVINEILYRRKDAASPEFVELYNVSDQNFDLSGWTLTDASGNMADLLSGTYLTAGEYLVLTDMEDFAATSDQILYLSDFPSLNDSGDELVLKTEVGVTIDSLFYLDSWGGDEPGISLERKDPAGPANDGSNWATSTSETGYSIAAQSSVFAEDLIAPEIIFSTQIDSVVKVVFSEFVNITDETSFEVNGFESELVSHNPVAQNEVFLQWYENELNVPAKQETGLNFDVVVRNISDYKGNRAAEISQQIASPIQSFPVVINEILFDPLANSDDNLPDQTEYVELFNPNQTAVSLEGIVLHDAPDEDGEVRSILPVSTQYAWIPAGEFALIYAEDEAIDFSDSRIAKYFNAEDADERFALRVDRSSLSLASSGDAIYLADSTGAIVDSVYFDENWQNPNLYDTDGIALELIDPSLDNNDPSNWSSSTHVSGGTPLAENSIYQKSGQAPDGVGISFSPNPFSPDDDGFEDNLFINYTLDAPDYLLRVRIFDRYGREVRELVQAEAAGFSGTLIWDGLTDDNRRNRVGIYIVLFEAYDSATGRDQTFKETVVLARKF